MLASTKVRSSAEPSRSSLMDAKLLLRALIELNIARKNLMSYPEGHHQIAAGLRQAHLHLCAFLVQEKQVTISVMKDGLTVAGKHLEPGHAVIKDLAAALHERRIAGLVIDQSLSPDDIAGFLRVVIHGAQEPTTPGAVPSESKKILTLNSIRVYFIDYAKFHHTTEEAVAAVPEAKEALGTGSLWQDYVQYLTADALTASTDGVPLLRGEELTPADLAAYVNAQTAPGETALKSYERAIRDHLQRSKLAAVTPSSGHWVQEKFRSFIEVLNPSLRKQFLSVTFDQWRQINPPAAETALNFLPVSMVIDMLIEANKAGQEISPSLLNFVCKLSGVQQAAESGAEGSIGAAVEELLRLRGLDPQKGLFRKENYEAFVGTEYDRMLQTLLPNQQAQAAGTPPAFDLPGEVESLSEGRLTVHLSQALMAMLKQETEAERYRDHAANLMVLVDDLARLGEFERLADVFNLLTESGAKQDPTSAIARSNLERFKAPGFVSLMLRQLDELPGPALDRHLDLLASFGPDVAPQVLSHGLAGKAKASRKMIAKVAVAFPHRTSDELAKRLRDADHAEFLRLQFVVEMLNGEIAGRLLAPFLVHQDRRIRHSALETLLRRKDPAAIGRLKSLLGSSDSGDRSAALELAGRFGLRELTPSLAGMLRRGLIVSKSDLAWNEKIISTIGRLGGCLPQAELDRLLKTRFSLHPARLMRMKASLKALCQG